MSHVTVGPLDRLAGSAGSGKTYREKYAGKECAECTKPLVDAEGFQTDVWRCGNAECCAIMHVKCVYKFIKKQLDTSNSERFGCPKCSTEIGRKDRERIMFIYIDMLEKQIADLTQLCEELAARLHTSETARSASEAEHRAQRALFETRIQMWDAERRELIRERDEYRKKLEQSESERLAAFKECSKQMASMQEYTEGLRQYIEGLHMKNL